MGVTIALSRRPQAAAFLQVFSPECVPLAPRTHSLLLNQIQSLCSEKKEGDAFCGSQGKWQRHSVFHWDSPMGHASNSQH